MTIEELREEITKTDARLCAAFTKRMKLCGEMGRLKKNLGIDIADSGREKEVIDYVKALGGEFSEETEELYKKILNISKDYQKKTMESGK